MLSHHTPMSVTTQLFGVKTSTMAVPTLPMRQQMSFGGLSRLSFGEIVAQFGTTTSPTFDRKACENLPEEIPLQHFTKEDYGNVLYRCESANKKYPAIVFSDALRSSPALWITVQLFNATTKKNMRTPDIKTNAGDGLEKHRSGDGLLVRPNRAKLSFKKKSVKRVNVFVDGEQRMVAKDFAFSLSARFESFTDEEDAQFVFVAVPFDGRFVVEKAVRSEPFIIKSKRQEKRLGHRTKRRKRNAYIEKLDTDIHCAECTLRQLNDQSRRLELIISQFDTCFRQLNSLVRLRSLTDPTMRLALEFALRDVEEEETASL